MALVWFCFDSISTSLQNFITPSYQSVLWQVVWMMLVMFVLSQPRRHSVVTVAWQAQRISDTRLSLVLTALVCWLIADRHWIEVRSPPLVEGRRRVDGSVQVASVRLVRHCQLRRVTALLHAETPPEVCVQTTAFAHHLQITKGTTH